MRSVSGTAHPRNASGTVKAGGVVVALLAVAAGVGAVIDQQRGEDKAVDAKPITGGRSAARPSTLTVCEDFRCPACGQFENAFRSTIHELEETGKLKVEYHLATIIDGNMGGTGSLQAPRTRRRARRTPGSSPRTTTCSTSNQPARDGRRLRQEQHADRARRKVDGLDTPALPQLREDGKHNGWVEKSNAAFKKAGFQAARRPCCSTARTSTGNRSQPLTPAKLKQRVGGEQGA